MPKQKGLLVKRLETQNEKAEWGLMKVGARRFRVEKKEEVFPIWTALQDCEGTECVAACSCPYLAGVLSVKEKQGHTRKCQVMSRYLKMVETMIIRKFGKDLSEAELFRVGIHLIPLYKQLIRFKIIEMSIMTKDVGEMTKSGTTKINALFKEMREVLRAIDATWREIGISKARQPDAPDVPKDAKKDYYEVMERDALREQNKLKIVKRTERNG